MRKNVQPEKTVQPAFPSWSRQNRLDDASNLRYDNLEMASTTCPLIRTLLAIRERFAVRFSRFHDPGAQSGATPFSFPHPAIDLSYRTGSSYGHRPDQSAIPSQDSYERRSRHRHVGHLEAGVAGVPEQFSGDFHRTDLQGAQ